MGISNFSVFTAFKAKDGVTPVFNTMSKRGTVAGLQVQSGMAKAKSALIALKGAAVAASGAIAAVGAFVPLKAFADWDKGIRNVYTLLDRNEIDIYGKKIKELSKQGIAAGLAAEDVNKALFNAISGMGASEKTFDTYQKALVLAKGGNAELSTTLSGMIAVMNAWGQSTTDATTVANAFFTAQKTGVTDVQSLAENIGAVAPLAKSMGLSLEETMAAMSALTKGGMSTDAATTGLRATLTALAKASGDSADTLKQFGVPVGIAEVRAKGLSYTLQKLIELQKKAPNAITTAIPNVKALTGVLAMDEEKLSEVHRTLGLIERDIKNGTGLNDAFKMMNSSDAATMARVMGEMQVALINLGEVVAPYLMPLVKKFGELVKCLGELSPKINDIVGGVQNFANHLKPLVVLLPVVTGLMAGFAAYKIVQGFQMLQVQAALFSMTLKSQMIPQLLASIPVIWSQTAALLANPIFWIPAAIAAVVTAAVLLWKNWDKVTESFKNAVNWLTGTTFGKIISCIFPVIGVVALLAKHWDVVKSAVGGFWSKTVEVLGGLWEKTKAVFGAIGTFLKEHFIDILLVALGPIGQIVLAITKISSGIKSIGKDGKGIKVETVSGETPNKTPKVQNNPGKGQIGVDVNLTNKTDKNATVTTRVESSNDLQLKPA